MNLRVTFVFPSLYPIGLLPLFLHQSPQNEWATLGSKSNLWKEDTKCLEWLESKKPSYVSRATPEFALGLVNSKKLFLWIIKPDPVFGGPMKLSTEFVNETLDRGLIASWCPLEQVLNHPSIGGILTHCGWNSTIESICARVPMLCKPFDTDQPTNCKCICNEWDIGNEIDTNVKREEVKKLINELIVGEKGKKRPWS
ncbi:7-deoxyloganetin glucosyltransferase [Spatholobus suberectus]|nr:7-deoxyloganetin glucosyltransferase [Spatholobus suberectus]